MSLNRRARVIMVVEIGAAIGSAVLAVLWMRDPSGPYEPYVVAAGISLLVTELFRRYGGRFTEGVERTPAERIHHHEKLRALFREEIDRCRAKKLRKDVVIRHVNRLDDYPNIAEKPGISPWFKVGLLDTYHAGIKVGLAWEGLVESPSGLRKPDHRKGERGTVTLMLMGEIPYDVIETMNLEGDEYYYLPHIFCHFPFNGEPYQRLYYAEEIKTGHGHSDWAEAVTYDEVRRNSAA